MLDLSPRTEPGGAMDDGRAHTSEAAAGDLAASQRPVHERWRVYRGSPTGVGLQLLNALAAAEAADDVSADSLCAARCLHADCAVLLCAARAVCAVLL